MGGFMLTKEQIWAADDLKSIDVNVSQWGGAIRVRTMTGKERQVFQKKAQKDGEPVGDFLERLIVACAVDKDGKPLFAPEDIKALSEKSSAALETVFKVAAELNGLTSESVEDIKGE